MIKIILVEDHLVVRSGIKLLFDDQDNIDVIAEANNGLELLALLEEGLSPDIVLVDINMPEMGGIELTERLAEDYPNIKVVLLTMMSNSQQVLQAFSKNAKGYLVKNICYDELIFALNHIAKGGRYLCDEIAMHLVELLQNYSECTDVIAYKMENLELSEREMEVLQLIGEGFTNTEIADKLFLSKRTVEGHRQSLIGKAKVKNSASLIKFAVVNKLIQ